MLEVVAAETVASLRPAGFKVVDTELVPVTEIPFLFERVDTGEYSDLPQVTSKSFRAHRGGQTHLHLPALGVLVLFHGDVDHDLVKDGDRNSVAFTRLLFSR